jgi:hypothetical protein
MLNWKQYNPITITTMTTNSSNKNPVFPLNS